MDCKASILYIGDLIYLFDNIGSLPLKLAREVCEIRYLTERH